MMLIAVGSVLRGLFALIDLLEPSLVAGQRPLWWRITSSALAFIALAIAPLMKIEDACYRFMRSAMTSDRAAFCVALSALRASVAAQSEILASAYAVRAGKEYDRAVA